MFRETNTKSIAKFYDVQGWLLRQLYSIGAVSLARKIGIKQLKKFYAQDYEIQKEFQLRKLRAIIKTAQSTIYWGEIIKYQNYKNSRNILEELPPTRRENIISLPSSNFLNKNLLKLKLTEVKTSGTTGNPLVFYKDASTFFQRGLNTSVWLAFMGLDVFDRNFEIISHTQKPWDQWFGTNIELHKILDKPLALEKVLKRRRPVALYAKVSELYLLAELFQKYNIQHKFRLLFSYAEPLFPHTRIWLEKTLGGTLYDKYASTEFGTIGFECWKRNGYHVASEHLLIEIMDDNGKPLDENKTGLIVITALDNIAMPLLRYVTGDRGFISNQKCPCGFNNPRLFILGRESDYFTHNSKKMYASDINSIIAPKSGNVRHWQILYTNKGLKIIFVADNEFIHKQKMDFEEKIRGDIKNFIGENISIEIAYRETVEMGPNYKIVTFSDKTR